MRITMDRIVCRGNRLRVMCGLLLIAVGIVGCTSSDGKPAAEEAVDRFHAMLNNERYGDIYKETGPKLKEVTSEREMIELLKTVHMKLGTVKSTKTSQGRMNSFLTETQIILIQETEFESGEAIETFTFSYSNKKAWLVGYKINSGDMVLE